VGLDKRMAGAGIAELASRLEAMAQPQIQYKGASFDRGLETYLKEEGLGQNVALAERIAVGGSSGPAAQYLIASAARMAQRIEAELFFLYIDIGVGTRSEDQASFAHNLRFAENLGCKVIGAKREKCRRGSC
jgi:K+-sensing histidine kinase KdpD